MYNIETLRELLRKMPYRPIQAQEANIVILRKLLQK
jgi:hypothetical protein